MTEKFDDLINKFRIFINEIDKKLIVLLNKRSKFALEIGDIKKKNNLPIFCSDRENYIINKLKEINNGPLLNSHIEMIWKEIMSINRSLEKNINVSYLGPSGTYSEQVMYNFFGKLVNKKKYSSINEIFSSIENNQSDFGIIPIENSSEGIILSVLDFFLKTTLFVNKEFILKINHNLLTLSGNIKNIKYLCAHSQAIAQCSNWLSINMNNIKLISVSSNAEAACIASNDLEVAAISSKESSDYYNLKIACSSIQNDLYNSTRFFIVSKNIEMISRSNKTSFIFLIKNLSTYLFNVLKIFKKYKVKIIYIGFRSTRIYSWKYYCYIDIVGHIDEIYIFKTLMEIKKKSIFFKIIGSYSVFN